MSENLRIPYEASALPAPARAVLVVAPHPDDEVFGCGGSAALYARAGIRVQALILTDGGLWGVPPEGVSVVEARKQEARQAAVALGCEEPVFGPYADRGLESGSALAELIASHARRIGADLVMAPSPWEIHPDHRAAAQGAIDAVAGLGAGHMLAQYELGSPQQPNVLVDITPVWAQKARAMACFASQLAMQRYDRHVEALNAYRSYTLPGSVLYAEGMRVATAQEALDDPFGLVHKGAAHPLVGSIRQAP